jgi:hypothetical protein
MRTQIPHFLERVTFRFMGGGGAPRQAAVPPPIPPVTSTNTDVQQASADVKLQNARRKGLQSTILAGETGGTAGTSGFPQLQTKTLLGG